MEDRNTLVAGVSGVRGIVGPGMNPDVAVRYTAAYAATIGSGLVVVGRDPRPSGPMIASVVLSTLRFMGRDVVDLGIVSTPTVGVMVRETEAAGGVIVTASHNGPEWNALKFLDAEGEFLGAAEMEDVAKRTQNVSTLFARGARAGSIAANDGGDAVHIRRILELPRIDRAVIASRRFAAAVDCVNGAGSRIVPALLRELGVTVAELFTDPEKPFPHDPEPRPANLGELSKAVARGNADIGFACDPDGDRLVLVSGDGTVCSEELTLAIAADFVLKRERGPVVANLSTSRLIDDIGRKHGVPVERSKVGEANVIALMKETGAVIGGEGNGGVIYPRHHYGRDAMLGIAFTLQALAEEGVSLAEKVAAYPRYFIVKEKFRFDGDFSRVAEAAAKSFPGRTNTLDGIRIDMEEGWVHLRRSNTEPVVRIIAEATSVEEAKRIAKEAGELLS